MGDSVSDLVSIQPHWLIQGLVVWAVTWILPRVFRYLQKHTRMAARGARYRHLRLVRRISGSQALTTDQAVRTYVFQAIFLLSLVVFSFAFIAGPVFLASSGFQRILLMLLSLPIFIFEIMFLNRSTLYKAVLKRRVLVERHT